MNPTNLIARLTGRKLAAAVALLDSGAADAALDAQEQQTLARRRTLTADLLAAPELHQAQIERAAGAYTDAVVRRVKAQAAMAEAWRLEAEAWSASISAQHSGVRAVVTIERDLIDTADGRLARMLFLLNVLDGNVRAALSFYALADPTRPALRPQYSSNLADTQAARRVIADCERQCTALLIDAVGYDDTTARLGNMCTELAGPLLLLELNSPQLGADGQLESPLPWGATGSMSRWRVETATPQPRQLEPIVDAKRRG
jgi:hypothetical protein